jgi:xylulokinase
MTWVIGADLGTSGCKAAVYDADGTEIASTIKTYETFYPQPGFHEQSLDDWWSAVCAAISDLVAQVGGLAAKIRAISLSGQSLALIPLDVQGSPLVEHVPIWSDTRAQKESVEYFSVEDEADWYARTGNGFPAALYTLFKVMWFRNQRPEVFAATTTIIGSKDWINFRFTGEIKTDPSYASGLGAFDLGTGAYAPDLLESAGLTQELFPPIVASTVSVGQMKPDIAVALGLQGPIEVIAGGVDNSCMALGALNISPGRMYAALGSSSWLTLCSRKPILDESLRPFVFAHVIPGLFNSAVSTFASGTSVSFIADTFFPELNGDIDALVELALTVPVGADGLVFVPTINGGTVFEGGPDVRGSLVGLSGSHTKAHIARAVIEAIPMALRRPLDRLRDLTTVDSTMIVTGGGARNSSWLQLYADIVGQRLVKTTVDQQAATLGAAALAFMGTGVWDSFEQIEKAHQNPETFEPEVSRTKEYESDVLPRFAAAARHARELSTL